MPTRREMLHQLGAAGVSAAALQSGFAQAEMPANATAPNFEVPSGACDCHVHVFDPDRFPYAPNRSYTPGPASVDDLLAFEDRIGMSRCVLVQASPYGSDNACLSVVRVMEVPAWT